MASDADRILEFLSFIGLGVRVESIGAPTILPGIAVDRGVLVVDVERLTYPGDLLHEAGHLAVTPTAERDALGVDVGEDGGAEMAALAWSYAAALHVGLDPSVVFHDGGYRSGADALIENFAHGRYVGVPILIWRGMTTERDYPSMHRWLAE